MAIKERRNSGPSGIAQVNFLTKSVRITFEGTEGQPGDIYDLPLDAVEKGRKSAKYRVDMTADKTKAYLHPLDGKYILKFKEMGNRVVGASQGQPGLPTSKMTESRVGHRKDGGTYPIPRQLIFVSRFTVESEGPYQGMVVTTNVPYSFDAPQRGSSPLFFDERGNLNKIEKFFKVCGNINIALDEEMPFAFSPEPTTMLLAVEKALQKADISFLGDVRNGFLELKSIDNVPADLLPKKKPVKKARK